MAVDVSVLIGGKAGDGINSAGIVLAQLLNHHGYHTFMYYDYPSLIRGGHNFALIRGSDRPAGIHRNRADFLLALNQDTLTRHRDKISDNTVIIFNSDTVKREGAGISVAEALKTENAPAIMGNSAIIGAFAGIAGIPWAVVETVFTRHVPKGSGQNLRIARYGYDTVTARHLIPAGRKPPQSLVSGNEAIGLGLVSGGLSSYISYPMTPSSGILHFLAENAEPFGLTVLHPENEIAAILTALGFAYAGSRSAVGTSGGGFCLMTEGLSLSGMAEIPIVIVVSQRTGPSTGLPTYTAQSDLHFILSAGQGEFPRFVAAPGDAAEAYFWSAAAIDIAWKFQVPAFLLADKTLSEGMYCIDYADLAVTGAGVSATAEGGNEYQRYADTVSGISPMAYPGMPGTIVKVNSYAHDTAGITTEDAETVTRMADKRRRKAESLKSGIMKYRTVTCAGAVSSPSAAICWGSVKGACREACEDLGVRMVHPVVLSPFPLEQLKDAIAGVQRLIVVEENSTGQLSALLQMHGIVPSARVLHDNGRPLTPDILKTRLNEVIP